ncbi:MAG: hypothetical protein ACK4RK_13565 [Gemmataceae bacterium]
MNLDKVLSRWRLARLFDQQLWCWGCDIDRPVGNLLLRHGFQRERPPHPNAGCTAYRLIRKPNQQLVLWGFGLFFGAARHGGLFWRRYRFDPKWAPLAELPSSIWNVEELSEFRAPRSGAERGHLIRLLAMACRWMADYEQAIADSLGPDYRRQCLHAWPKKAVAAVAIPQYWRCVARHAERYVPAPCRAPITPQPTQP